MNKIVLRRNKMSKVKSKLTSILIALSCVFACLGAFVAR